jgi:hypothetical protein
MKILFLFALIIVALPALAQEQPAVVRQPDMHRAPVHHRHHMVHHRHHRVIHHT